MTETQQTKYRDYIVVWMTTLQARSSREAAEIALQIQQDPSSLANVFLVRENDGRNEWWLSAFEEIDLSEEDEDDAEDG